ncbi:hypothetical protein BKA63DRAFT_497719 [Paraphoma chrysanthemicola]|nr:hypothetical protein BKA63DRAFT_497719 [Paraphoma chrysanthemicola]
MNDLFLTELCRGLEQPRKPRSALASYFESCYDSDRKYKTPPPTPPKEPQRAGRVQAISTPSSPCRAASPPTTSITQLGATNGASKRTGKKRKYEDEDPDHDNVRRHRPRRSAMHAIPSGVEYVGWDRGRKRARDDKDHEREPKQHQDALYLHQAKPRNASKTFSSREIEKACYIDFAGQAKMRRKESDQKAYHKHTRSQLKPRRSKRIQAIKISALPHTSCGKAARIQTIRQEQKHRKLEADVAHEHAQYYRSTIRNHKPPPKLDAKLNDTSTRKRRKCSDG